MFKRGRYVSLRSLAAAEAGEAKGNAGRQERERFSVAAIAFCIEHDASFKRHFLHGVAGLSPEDVTKVTVEPHHCADLLLEGARHVLVLEFKLGALLQDKQSPESRIFTEVGYGAKIRDLFTSPGKELRYVVIGDKDFKPRDLDGLQCSSIPWLKLLMPSDEESSIEKDLYDCLGHLGAPVFLCRQMKNRKLATEAKGAMTVFGTLQHLLESEGIPMHRYDSNVNAIGLSFRNSSATPGTLHSKLVETVQSVGKDLGWLGYETGEDGKGCISVYFYANSETAPEVRRRLDAAKGVGRTMMGDPTTIISYLPCDESVDDLEWFVKVLKTVAGV